MKSGSITPKESLQRFTEDMFTKLYFSRHGCEIQPFTGVWPQTLVWLEIDDLGYQDVVRLPDSSTRVFLLLPISGTCGGAQVCMTLED